MGKNNIFGLKHFNASFIFSGFRTQKSGIRIRNPEHKKRPEIRNPEHDPEFRTALSRTSQVSSSSSYESNASRTSQVSSSSSSSSYESVASTPSACSDRHVGCRACDFFPNRNRRLPSKDLELDSDSSMDSTDSTDSSDSTDSRASTSSSTSYAENEKKVSSMIESKRANFFQTYKHQKFSLPDSVMLYVAMNPTTPGLYKKMIRTCKFFFVKNPILVFSYLDYERNKWRVNRKPLKLDNFTSKFWITIKFRIQRDKSNNNIAIDQNIAASITPRLFRCDAVHLYLHDQIIASADLSLIFSTAEKIVLANVTIKDDVGSIVGIEKIIALAVKAYQIEIKKPPIASITCKTMAELVKIPNFSKLGELSIDHIPEVFDIDAFYVYMKTNQDTSFNLGFDDSCSAAYKNRLEQIIDETIRTKEELNYRPPYLHFDGLNEDKHLKHYCICMGLY